MKVAMIGQKQVPSRKGGIEVAVGALAVRMFRRGHHITLYNWRRLGIDSKIKGKQKAYQGVRIYEIPIVNVKGVSAMISSCIATVCALFGRYDCIHFHAEGPAVMTFLPHIFGIRTVVTIHGLDWKRSKWGKFASWYLKLGEKMAVSYADEIIVLSHAMRQYFYKTYNRCTVLIPNGIERPVKREAKRITDKWGLTKDDYILYLGRIVPEKGIENLIRTYGKVNSSKKLVIAGSPADTEQYFKRLNELAGDDDRIIFTGFVQGEVLDELYSNCYLYCLPSELEGMPISLLEAMSYGNCCLCSDIKECTEVLGEFGYSFQSGNKRDFRQVLQNLCDHPEMIERCRSHVEDYVCEKYNWDETTQKTLDIYQSVQDRRRRK